MAISPRQLLNTYMLKKFSGKEWFGINEEVYMDSEHEGSLTLGSEDERPLKKKDKEEKKKKAGESDAAHRRRMRAIVGEDHHSDTNFVGSISPREGLHKIMLTNSGHVVLVYQDSFPGASSRWTGHVHSHPDGQLIRKIKIDPAEIGE